MTVQGLPHSIANTHHDAHATTHAIGAGMVPKGCAMARAPCTTCSDARLCTCRPPSFLVRLPDGIEQAADAQQLALPPPAHVTQQQHAASSVE